MLRIGGTVWGTVIIAGYAHKEYIGLYIICGYSLYEILVNTGTSWALYPTNWLTEIDSASNKKYEE
jgi:hypothetical protein